MHCSAYHAANDERLSVSLYEPATKVHVPAWNFQDWTSRKSGSQVDLKQILEFNGASSTALFEEGCFQQLNLGFCSKAAASTMYVWNHKKKNERIWARKSCSGNWIDSNWNDEEKICDGVDEAEN